MQTFLRNFALFLLLSTAAMAGAQSSTKIDPERIGWAMNPTATVAAQANLAGMNPACTPATCYYIAVGDSTSCGYLQPGGCPASTAWPAQLAQMPYFKNRVTFINKAIAGSTWEAMASRYPTDVEPYLPNGSTILQTYVSVMIGRNDLTESPATIESGVGSYANMVNNAGGTVLLGTMLPSTTVQGPPLTGVICNISAFASSGSSTSLTCSNTNAIVAGEYIYLNGISATPTLTGTTVTATACAISSGVVTVTGTNSFAAGNFAYLSGFTGACSVLNAYWVPLISASSSQFTFDAGALANLTATSTTGTVQGSTGAGINLNGNVAEVTSATSSSLVLAIYGGSNYASVSNTGTAETTSASGWDPVQPYQETTLELTNDWYRRYLVCGPLQTTNCVAHIVDMAQTLKNPNNAGIDTYDGTHPTPNQSTLMALAAESVLTNNGPSLPPQPYSSGVSPSFDGQVSANALAVQMNNPDGLAGGGPALNYPYNFRYFYNGALYDDTIASATTGYAVTHRALSYQFICGSLVGGGSSCFNILASGLSSTLTITTPNVLPAETATVTAVAAGITPTPCAGWVNTSKSGCFSVASTTFTTGAMFSLTWAAQPITQCPVSPGYGTAGTFGIFSSSAPSTTGVTFSASTTIAGQGFVNFYYHCDPQN